jgi:hypothetical protein
MFVKQMFVLDESLNESKSSKIKSQMKGRNVMKKSMKVKRRIRWSRVAMMMIILIICMSFAVNALADTGEQLNYTMVTVGTGDSLWGLIKEYNPDYSGNMNEAIYSTCRLNDMPTAMLSVGQTIRIPNLQS